MKKLLALLLATIMLLTVVACASDTTPSTDPGTGTADPGTTAPGTDPTPVPLPPGENTMFEPQTITVYQGGTLVTETSQWSETPIGKIVEDITGITIQMEYLGGAVDTERTAIIIAGGEYPDVIMGSHRFGDFRDAGALIPINDLYEANCPTIKANWGVYINRIKDQDTGILWGLSAAHFDPGSMTHPGSGFYLKYDAVEMNGNKAPESLDDYFDIIRRYVEANPTTAEGASTIGFSGPSFEWRFVFTVHGARKPMGWHNTGRFLHDPDKDFEGIAANTFDWNVDYFLRLRNLREDGLFDPEIFSQDHNEYVAKIAAGRIVGMYDEDWQLGDAKAAINSDGRYQDYPVGFAVYHPDRMTNMNCAFAGITAMATTTDISISVHAENPALILQYWDFLATDKMQELLWWGVEGEHYQKDTNGRRYLTEEQYRERADNVLFGNDTGIAHGGMLVPSRIYRDAEWPDGSGVTDPFLDRIGRADIMYSDVEKHVLGALGWTTFWDAVGEKYANPFGYGWDIGPSEEQEELVDMLNFLNSGGGYSEFGQTFFQHMVEANSDAEALAIWDTMQQWLVDNGVHALEEEFTRRVRIRVAEWY